MQLTKFSDYALRVLMYTPLTAFLAVLDQHSLASVALKPKDFRAVFQTAWRPTASREPTA